MKNRFSKLLSIMLAVLIVFSCFNTFVFAETASNDLTNEVYVSASGSDTTGLGTKASPYATIGKAIDVNGPGNDLVVNIIGSKFQFADKAHTGTVTYNPVDGATFAGGTLVINGPSVINVNAGATTSYYSNGHDLEIGGTTPESFVYTVPSGYYPNDVYIGTTEGSSETVTLKGQYYSTVFCSANGSEVAGNVKLIIDGAIVRMANAGAKSTKAVPNNLKINVVSGELRAMNYSDTGFNTTNNSTLELVFNKDLYNINPKTSDSDTEYGWKASSSAVNPYTTAQLFNSAKWPMNGGNWRYRSSDANNVLYVTDETGVYEIVGEKTLHFVSADGRTVYTTKNGKVTLPQTGTGITVLNWDATPFTIEDATVPTLSSGEQFYGWIEGKNGVYTADIRREAYVSASGNDSTGKGTKEAPFASITKAIDVMGAENDQIIYIVGSGVKFVDKAHTGTITYKAVDGATVPAGTIKLNGPTILDVDVKANVDLYTNGNYFELRGTPPTIEYHMHSPQFRIITGNDEGKDEEIVLKAQFVYAIYDGIPGQKKPTHTSITIDGAVVRQYNPGAPTASSHKLGSTFVNVKSGQFRCVNAGYGETGASGNLYTDGYRTFVFNNNTYDFKWYIFASSASLSGFKDYLKSKIDVAGGYSMIINSDTSGNYLNPTKEDDVYEVTGTKTAWYQSSDKKTVYYSKNGKIKLPVTGTVNINWTDDIKNTTFTAPPATSGVYDFLGWKDNGDGVLTAEYGKAYYVKGGGTGNGKTPQTPAGSIPAVVTTINADGLKAGDIATVYIINNGEPEDKISQYDKEKFVPYNTATNVAHTATVKITSYDQSDPSWLMFTSTRDIETCTEKVEADGSITHTVAPTNGYYLAVQGPTIFENINLLETRTSGYYYEFYAQGHDVELRNVKFMKTVKGGKTPIPGDVHGYNYYVIAEKDGSASERHNILYTQSNRAGTGTSGKGGRVFIDNGNQYYTIYIGSFTDGTTTQATLENDVTLVIDSGKTKTVCIDVCAATKNMTYKKNVNLVLNNGASITNLVGKSVTTEGALQPIINGAFQVILNGGATVPAIPDTLDSKGNPTPVYKIISETGGTLDVTDETAVYTVDSDKIAYVQSEDLFTVYYGSETIKLGEAGEYKISYADSVEDIIAAVEKPVHEKSYYQFKQWKDDGEKLTAEFEIVLPIFYVSASEGDDENNTGLTEDSPLKTVAAAITKISAIGDEGTGIVAALDEVPFEDIEHEGHILYQEDGGSFTYTENITLHGPSTFNADLPDLEDAYIITNGHALEINDKSTSLPEDKETGKAAPMVIMGPANEESVVLSGGYINSVAGRIRGIISGMTNITVDGATVREVLLGALENGQSVTPAQVSLLSEDGADENVGNEKWDTIVTDVNLLVNSGELWYLKDGWCKDTEAMGALQVIFNNNTAKKLVEDQNKVVFNNGKWVLKSADTTGNVLDFTETAGTFTVVGANYAYALDADGETAYYSVDGKLTLPAGTYDILYTDEFKVSLLPAPTLESGYTFDGWVDGGNGVCKATIVPPVKFYVSKNGNDENVGSTASSPLKTIEKAIENLRTFDGTVIIIDEATYPEVKYDIDLHITGNTPNAVLYYGDGDMVLGGNTQISNIVLCQNTEKSLIDTNGNKFTLGEGVTYTYEGVGYEKPVVTSGSTDDDYDKLVLSTLDIAELAIDETTEITKIVIDGANIGKLSVATDSDASVIKAYVESGSLTSVDVASDAAYKAVEIIANNGVEAPKLSSDKGWSISSENAAESRVDFTDVPGTYGVVTEYGKTPIAVGDDGKVYVADKFTSGDESVHKEYEENTYEKFINYRSPLTHAYKKLTEDKELSVVYYGGSVTNGSVTNNWRTLTMDWFEETYPDVDFTFTNAASGESGTFLGTYRVQRDVIAKKPDLLFLEYTINDKYYYGNTAAAQVNSRRGAETIIREVKQALPDCDIIMLYVADHSVRSQWLSYPAKGHEEIAVKYNITSALVGQALIEHMEEVTGTNRSTWSSIGSTKPNPDPVWSIYFRDIVHLTEAGNLPYYYVLREILINELMHTEYESVAKRHNELPAVVSDHLNDGNRKTVSPTAADATANGSIGLTYSASKYPLDYIGRLSLPRSNPDAQFVYNFEGTEIAIYTNITGSDGGVHSYSIDGGAWQKITHMGHGPNLVISDIPARDLGDGTYTTKHTITLKPDWTDTKADYSSMLYGIICTRDATIETKQGAEHVYEDYTNGNFVLPEGNYDVKYVNNGTKLSDLTFVSKEGLTLTWQDEEGNTLADSTVLEKGKVYVPVFAGPVLLNGVAASINNDTVTATESSIVTFDNTKKIEKENSLYLGWFHADGTPVVSGETLEAGTVITAKYVPFETNYYESDGETVNTNSDFVTVGAQIRFDTTYPALRFVNKFTKDTRAAIGAINSTFIPTETNENAGYGYVVIPKERLDSELVIGTDGSVAVPAVKTFTDLEENDYIEYTVCITDVSEMYYDRIFAVVPYIVYNDAQGNSITVYGEVYDTASVYSVAKEALVSGDYASGSDEYTYLEAIVNSVEG